MVIIVVVNKLLIALISAFTRRRVCICGVYVMYASTQVKGSYATGWASKWSCSRLETCTASAEAPSPSSSRLIVAYLPEKNVPRKVVSK